MEPRHEDVARGRGDLVKRCSICGRGPAGLYPAGWRCEDCTPAVCAGHPEPPTPDPALTLDGLRKAAGLVYGFRATDTALSDERAIASGRRRSSPAAYRAARAAEETRKSKR